MGWGIPRASCLTETYPASIDYMADKLADQYEMDRRRRMAALESELHQPKKEVKNENG